MDKWFIVHRFYRGTYYEEDYLVRAETSDEAKDKFCSLFRIKGRDVWAWALEFENDDIAFINGSSE